jgi:arylsulfatase A-like enzyme
VLTDLAPTVLDLAGFPTRGFDQDGRTLARAVLAEAPLDAERPVFFQRRTYQSDNDQGVVVQGEKFGVRMGPLKYIEAEQEASYELYDLRTDPGERTNLYSTTPDVAHVLSGALHAWLERPAATSSAVPDDVAERLRALGYR